MPSAAPAASRKNLSLPKPYALPALPVHTSPATVNTRHGSASAAAT